MPAWARDEQLDLIRRSSSLENLKRQAYSQRAKANIFVFSDVLTPHDPRPLELHLGSGLRRQQVVCRPCRRNIARLRTENHNLDIASSRPPGKEFFLGRGY